MTNEQKQILSQLKNEVRSRTDIDSTMEISNIFARYSNLLDKDFTVALLEEAYMSKLDKAKRNFISICQGKKTTSYTKHYLIKLAKEEIIKELSDLNSSNLVENPHHDGKSHGVPLELLADKEVLKNIFRVNPNLLTGSTYTEEFGKSLNRALTGENIAQLYSDNMIKYILTASPRLIELMPESIKNDENYAKRCVGIDPFTVKLLGKEIKENRNVLATAMITLQDRITISPFSIPIQEPRKEQERKAIIQVLRNIGLSDESISNQINQYADLIASIRQQEQENNNEVISNTSEDLEGLFDEYAESYLGLEKGSIQSSESVENEIKIYNDLDGHYVSDPNYKNIEEKNIIDPSELESIDNTYYREQIEDPTVRARVRTRYGWERVNVEPPMNEHIDFSEIPDNIDKPIKDINEIDYSRKPR